MCQVHVLIPTENATLHVPLLKILIDWRQMNSLFSGLIKLQMWWSADIDYTDKWGDQQ